MNCSRDFKNFANSRSSALNFKCFSLSLEQFLLTVGQNNFGNKICTIVFQKLFKVQILCLILMSNFFFSFSQGDVFKSMLDKYMRKALRKGIPPLFVDLVPLYENKSKASIIGNLCQGKKMNTVKLVLLNFFSIFENLVKLF